MSSNNQTGQRNVVETALVVLFLFVLLYALHDVLKLFFGVFTFALIFSVSFSRLFERLARMLKGRRKAAAFLYSLLLIIVVALPFVYMIATITHHVKDALHWVADAKANGLPQLPEWITKIPWVGDEISNYWKELEANPRQSIMIYEPQIRSLLHHILRAGFGILGAAVEVIAGIIISAILLVHRNKIAGTLHATLRHMVGEKNGTELMDVSAQAVRGVSVGVMGTAFIAAIVSWIGFFIAHVPIALLLSVAVFILVVIQIGPLLVWVPVVIWAFSQGHTGWAIFLVAYTVLVLAIDAVLKPVLIAKSGKLPFLVLFLGVIGGIAAWGFTGMFKGAIILAVFYTVFNSWMESRNRPRAVAHGTDDA